MSICPSNCFNLNWQNLLYKTISFSIGKSFSEALIVESVNPQYDKRFFMDFQEKYKLTTWCVQKLFLFLFWHSKQYLYTTCSQLVFFGGFNEQSLVILWVNWFNNESFWHRFNCTKLILFTYFSTWKEKRKNCLLWSKDFQKFSRWNNPNYIFLGAHGFVLPGRGYGQCYQSWPRSVRHVQTGTILRWSSQRVYHWWEKISPRFAYDYQSI